MQLFNFFGNIGKRREYHGVHGAAFAQCLGQAAGVQIIHADHAVRLEHRVQRALTPEIGRNIGKVAHDVRRRPNLFALIILRYIAIITDQRESLNDHLAAIAGIGQRLQIPRHAGGENGLARRTPLYAKRLALKHVAVFQQQVNLVIHFIPPSAYSPNGSNS